MSVPRNHHYVPAFYLNAWGDQKVVGKCKKVWCWGWTPDGRLIRSPLSTKSICSEEDLYAREGDTPEEEQQIEMNYFKRIDDAAAKVWPKLISGGPAVLDNDERSKVTTFLFALRVRNPAGVNMIKQLADDNLQSLLAEEAETYTQQRKEDWPQTLEELLNEQSPYLLPNFGINALPRIISGENNDEMQQILHKMYWIVADVSSAPRNLLTCDHPAIYTEGLRSEKCLVGFPLSPDKVLVATHTHEVAEAVHTISSRDPGQLVEMVNQNIINQARDWVISDVPSSENFIRKYFTHKLDEAA